MRDLLSAYDDLSRKQYRKNVDDFKPDHAAYNAQRAKTASAHTSSALIAASAEASGSAGPSEREMQAADDDLYRDANSFVYADHNPSEDAIDRVVGKLNLECVPFSLVLRSLLAKILLVDAFMARSFAKREKFSRERKNAVEGDVTYINDKNKKYNEKVSANSRELLLVNPSADARSLAPPVGTILPQSHQGDSRQFRAGYCAVVLSRSLSSRPGCLNSPVVNLTLLVRLGLRLRVLVL